MTETKYKYLGYVNGWPSVQIDGDRYKVQEPEEVQKCKALGHKIKSTSSKYGHHHYWCDECGYEYYMDSGD